MRLLVAEDERELANALAAILQHNQFSVDTVYNGQDAYDYGLSPNYDGILLDVMMPKLNGFEVVRKLREDGVKTPVLLLTAKSETTDKICGLDCGADDYLTKPFVMGELLARVRALTRRRGEYSHTVLQCGNLTLERATFELSGPDGTLRLGNREFQMLELLMEGPGRVVSTEQFMERIWGYDADAEISVVWVYISYLRKKLAGLGANVEIRAMRGVGYTLEARHD